MDFLPIKRALLSVTDKSGLKEFAEFLHAHDVEIVSTGGTMKFLKDAGIPVTAVRNMVEEIDIGGPCLMRATAKNFHSMLILPNPEYYLSAMEEIKNPQGVSLAFRKEMSAKTFKITSEYDAMISLYLEGVNV